MLPPAATHAQSVVVVVAVVVGWLALSFGALVVAALLCRAGAYQDTLAARRLVIDLDAPRLPGPRRTTEEPAPVP